MGRRLHAIRHPSAQHGFIHHAGIDALEPIIPPTQHLLQEADLRARKRKMRIPVCPRPDETLARYAKSLKKARNCVLIGIGPAADGVHRALDRRVILAYRSMLPIRVTSLVLQPKFENSGTFARRSNHIARQPSPTSIGSGGRHIEPKKNEAHSSPAVR